MCWHDWDVKKTKTRYFFTHLKVTRGIGHLFAVAGVLAALTVTLPITFYQGFSGDKLAIGVLVGLMGTIGYVIALCGGLDFLETYTKLKDKICLKCHLTILDATKTRAADVILQKKAKTLQEDADEVFKQRKEMWEKAQGV